MCGGGSSGPSSVSQTTIPEWAKPYAENTLASSQKLIYNMGPNNEVLGLKPPPQYSGIGSDTGRVAGFTPMEQAAAQNANNMRPDTGDVGSLTDEYSGVRNYLHGIGDQARNEQFYTGNAAAMLPEYAKNRAAAESIGQQAVQKGEYDPMQFTTGSIRDPGVAASYMSPYMQNVIDISKRETLRDANIQNQTNQAQAVQGGAFGGGRDALVRAEAQRNLGTRLSDMQTKGLQSALEMGVGQFNTEQGRSLEAQGKTEQSRQFGAGQGLAGLKLALEAAVQHGQMTSDEAGKRLQAGAQGLQGLGVANTAANLYGQSTADEATKRLQYGQQNYDQTMGITNQLAQFGGIQRLADQQRIDNAYQDFVNAQNYPYRQIGFASDVLRGTPAGDSRVYEATPSMASQAAGLAGAGIAASQLGK